MTTSARRLVSNDPKPLQSPAMEPSEAPPILDPHHRLSVALVHPQIAGNVGTIARLCTTSGAALHIVRPMGFPWDSAKVARAGLDYIDRATIRFHADAAAFLTAPPGRLWLFSSKGSRSFWDARYQPGDCLVFGSETSGLPELITAAVPPEQLVRIPQVQNERCLNLAVSAGIGLMEALRQLHSRTA